MSKFVNTLIANPGEYILISPQFKAGLGGSPFSAGPTGGWNMMPGQGFYGTTLSGLLPKPQTSTNVNFFGRKVHKRRHASRKHAGRKHASRSKRSFGYPQTIPLMNLESEYINMNEFPLFPTGPGDTPGGQGGAGWPGLSFSSLTPGGGYWGFGRKRRRSSKRRSRRRSRTN